MDKETKYSFLQIIIYGFLSVIAEVIFIALTIFVIWQILKLLPLLFPQSEAWLSSLLYWLKNLLTTLQKQL